MDIPIALRKGKRRCSQVLLSDKSVPSIDNTTDPSSATTPGRRLKRLRFSDSVLLSTSEPMNTGITPYLRRTSLNTPKRQRQSEPIVLGYPEHVQFTPFRQVLDDRIKRRIRRNGLSEEMNRFEADRKTTKVLKKEIEEKDAELRKVKQELENARAASVIPIVDSIPLIQERVDECEAELEALRQSFAIEDSHPVTTWDHVPRSVSSPRSDGGDTIFIYEDEEAQEAQHTLAIDADGIAMGLELEAAKQAKESMLESFRDSGSFRAANFTFPKSPARQVTTAVGPSPQTPRTFYHDVSKQLKTTTNRAENTELALKTLQTEVLSLGFQTDQQDASLAVAAILDHFRQARLELERTLPGETTFAFDNTRLLPDIIRKLKTLTSQLKTKEADLQAAGDQQHNLKGNFERAIVAAEKANARIKDLEGTIDTQAEDTLQVRMRAQQLEKDLAEKETDVERLTSVLNKYRADISRLEALITQLEQEHAISLNNALSECRQIVSDCDAKAEAETIGRRAAEQSAVSRLAKINELELTLSSTRQEISTLQSQLSSGSLAHSHEIGSLNVRIAALSTALSHANAEVGKLRVIKSKLELLIQDEVETSAQALEAIQAEHIRIAVKTNEDKKKYIRGAKVRVANRMMEFGDEDGEDSSSSVAGPMTPSSLVRFADFTEEIEYTPSSRIVYDDDEHRRHRGSTTHATGDDDNHNNHEGRNDDGDHMSDDLPDSVCQGRGRSSKSRSQDRQPRGLAISIAAKKSRPNLSRDSGIGMSSSPVSDIELKAAFEVEEATEGVLTMVPDLTSEDQVTSGHIVADVDMDA